MFIIALMGAVAANLQYVQNLQVPSYLGNWHEVASSPIVHWTFERNGYCVRASYGLQADGNISVTNIMRKGSPTGQVETITGSAFAPNPNTPAQLKVQLDGTPQANYWVVAVGPIINGSYQWALVSEPSKTFMWVLARNPTEYAKLYEKDVKALVKELGFTNFVNKYVERSWEGCTPYN
ncbi:hypothetical protein pb186bvf_015091 [Paramecium bursaria]